ncbi:MAG TPA: tripartite tricarboxylate transporter substrate binding protein [Ramlibacter sp.]|jgi:tripartite-type tricarboxylate transporter receptor subunit TctC|uniref:tripartite tricarboxylate transporter substrate binding protein n=1 Tax=Ramlibacter sp. TaxID=1917967 RepID=UPI002D2A150E|nr:tripartite tricarboxylate transporter substrate binding protein [Ramlibacter sp.]HZY18722.1 tripartite tricarboxylate transporter substrate binding protein [Ramlibacter sp.]
MQRRHFTAALAASVAAPLVRAQAWPARPIRVLVGYPPGGFTDVTARLVCDKLQARLGQPVIVDNKPGANGIVAVDTLAKAAPDGQTFAVVIAAHAANTTLYKKLPYDPVKDLAPVSLIGLSPLVLAVNNEAPYRNARELVAYAKANPGKISYGSSGNGSAVHLSTELLKSLTGTHMVHIPYRGSAAALTDLLGGQIQLFGDAAQGLISPGKAGKVRLVGVASDKRLPALPDVPTFEEQGVTGFVASTWAGVLAPAGTPAPIVKRVADEIATIVRQDDVRARLEAMGTIPAGSGPADFGKFIADETAKWGKVIREAKVTLD